MNGINGVIDNGEVYEVHKGDCCDKCAFYNEAERCAHFRHYCDAYECFFIFSQELTDKINTI